MNALRILILIFTSAIILFSGKVTVGTGPLQLPEREARQDSKQDGEEDEADRILERIRLYLRMHGDQGRIDPERRLREIREDYRRRRIDDSLRTLAPQAIAGTEWRSLGPTNGAGRMVAIAPHPTDTGTIYAGAAGGGVWKTIDSGVSWTPLTDSITDLSVGAVALAPSDPNTVYLGTGEGGLASDFIPGIGFLKSTDGGANWIFPSSVIAEQFFRILVHPSNPQELVAGTNQGGLRSTNGGSTWSTVISPGQFGDVTDIVRHPSNSAVLYATTWDRLRWCARAGTCSIESPRVLKSTDGGVTWRSRSEGLPVSTSTDRVSRMSIAISPSNPSVLYVATSILENAVGRELSHIYKSTDEGGSWRDLTAVASNTSTSINRYMGSQAWYDNTIVVSPTDENMVIAGGVGYVRSTDGGGTWSLPPFRSSSVHVDVHDLRYQGSTLYIANDGGIWSTPDNGETAADRNSGLVTRQYYAMTNDPANRNRIFAGTQDNGTGRRPDAGGTAWNNVIGADGFETGVSPLVPSFAFGTIQGGAIFRTKEGGSNSIPRFVNVTPPYESTDLTPFRTVLTVDRSEPATVYTGSSRIWKTVDAGETWTPLPTATTDGSIWTSSTVTSIAIAAANNSILMVSKGSRVFKSTDGGQSWIDVGDGLPAGVNNLEIDPQNPNIAYAVLARSLGGTLYKTVDGGETWSRSSEGLPNFSAQVVRVDPTDSNVLFCGVDVGVYRSTDQGATWQRFGTGLPATSVHDIRILDDGSMVRAATHGRGIWELQVPPTGNTPPVATISAPGGRALTVVRGTTVDFSGLVSDPDSGDSVTATWTFPDTWQTMAVAGGQTNVSHVFDRAGVFPVTLLAKDSRRAVSEAVVVVSVPEIADDCATAITVPGSGPFPFALSLNNEAGGTQGSDPRPSCVSAESGRSGSLWFEFTPSASAEYEFSTCGSSLDTVLSLWTGPNCGPYNPVPGACNDDVLNTTICGGLRSSLVRLQINAGQTIRVFVAGFNSASVGQIRFTVQKAFRIESASVSGKRLSVLGRGFAPGAVVLLNGEVQKTRNDDISPDTLLICKKAGKRIQIDQPVVLQVRNQDNSATDPFTFIRTGTVTQLLLREDAVYRRPPR